MNDTFTNYPDHPSILQTDQNPLLKSKSRILFALIKKQLKVRFRGSVSLVEIILSFLIFFVFIPIEKGLIKTFPPKPIPNVSYTAEFPLDLAIFFNIMNGSRLIAAPKSIPVISMMQSIYSNFLKYTPVKVEYAKDAAEIKKMIISNDVNVIGIHWVNSEKEDYLTHPKVDTYIQCLSVCPNYTIMRIVRSYIASEAMKANPENPFLNFLGFVNSSIQEFSSAGSKLYHNLHHVSMIFLSCSVLFSVMPDYDIIMDEKDSKVAALCFIMGCDEWLYYFVTFLIAFLCSIPALFVMSCVYCYFFLFTDISFSLFFTICLLYSSSYITFLLFYSSLFKSGSSGRSFSVIMAIFIIIWCYFHESYTLQFENDKATFCKNFCSLFPQSVFPLVIATLRINFILDHVQINWGNLFTADIPYKMSLALFWLAFDTFFYAFLFFLVNYFRNKKNGNSKNGFSSFFKKKESYKKFNDFIGNGDSNDNHELYDFNNNEEAFIKIENLSKNYGNIDALKNVSFEVKQNELIVVIGPNGAGKSTLINILSGILQSTGGSLTYLGENHGNDFTSLHSSLGLVFQENVFVDRLSVMENIELFGAFRGVHKSDISSFVDFFGDSLQMKSSLFTLAKNLSGGQKRKLCIAIALLSGPSFVLMDEPTSGVDVQARQHIWKFISSMQNTTFIITSHALEEAEVVASRLFVFSKGSITNIGSATELRNEYRCGYMMKIAAGTAAAQRALEVAQKYVPEANIHEEHRDTIYLPVCEGVNDFLAELERSKEEIGYGEFSLSVEQLEDAILGASTFV